MTHLRRRSFIALLGCVAALAGCRHEDSITRAEQPLTGMVWGNVYAPDGAVVANATVHVEARRMSDMILVASASAVSDAHGQYAATLAIRGFGQVRTTTVVQAHPPSGMVVGDGFVRGAVLYLDQDGGGTTPGRVDVTLGTSADLR